MHRGEDIPRDWGMSLSMASKNPVTMRPVSGSRGCELSSGTPNAARWRAD
ncbi:hypothetical protein M404DRAFT_377727 [Pisolithus tinctorius Marx 270]|uniref:Uncharacterized protein n=1 Tax=Pisolithus tinctorius Marx 270 TaxID=870435 RepID=A0A0C3P4I0_PISTI|nr:hypothetical protein M404DRAFT_377727 [Pisolithus tinctorius Marx 270]